MIGRPYTEFLQPWLSFDTSDCILYEVGDRHQFRLLAEQRPSTSYHPLERPTVPSPGLLACQ